MNFIALSQALSLLCLCVSVFAILPLGVALHFGETPQAFAFAFTIVFALLIGSGGWILSSFSQSRRRNGPSELLATTVFWWILAPIGCAVPFVLGVANPSIYLAVQESTACLTTTGYSVIEIGDEGWPLSLLIWRGVLHIIGAFASMFTLAAVLSQFSLSRQDLHRTPYYTVGEHDAFVSFVGISRKLTRLYLSFSIVVFLTLLFVGVPILDAFLDMASIISTGNANPVARLYSASPIHSAVIAIGLVISTAGFWVIYFLRRGQWRRAFMSRELLSVMFAIGVFTFLAWAAGLPLVEAVLWTISTLSTSNMFEMSGQFAGSELPLSLFVMVTLIGGASLSTAGGVKFSRIIQMLRGVSTEMERSLTRPGVYKPSQSHENVTTLVLIDIWVFIIAFTVSIAGLQLFLSVLGVGWTDAIRLSVGALSNAGGLIKQAKETTSLAGLVGATVWLAMIFGRLEVLPILAIFTKNFWTR